MGYEQMENRGPFCFLAAARSGQSHQREQGHWQRPAAHQSSHHYRVEDGGYHLAVKQNLSGSAVPSIANQVGGSHRDQGHGRQAGPLGLPHAALRHEIRGPRSSRLRASTPRVTDQAPQGQSPKARIPSHPNTGGGLTSRSFWREGRNRYGIMSSHDGVQFRLQHSALVLYLLMMHISGHLVELNDDVNGWAIGAVFESFKVVGQLVFFSVSKGDADRNQSNCNRQQHPSAPRSVVEQLRMDEVLFSLEPSHG